MQISRSRTYCCLIFQKPIKKAARVLFLDVYYHTEFQVFALSISSVAHASVIITAAKLRFRKQKRKPKSGMSHRLMILKIIHCDISGSHSREYKDDCNL